MTEDLAARFGAALGALLPVNAQRIAIAVSGGGDSLALLYLAAHLAPTRGWQLSAVTLDHGLRPEAAAEAAEVARVCAQLGLPHQTLRWSPAGVQGNLMEQASAARYRLIGDWARGCEAVLLGHTADDQAESLLMGLSRGAGLDGLAGMRPQWRDGQGCLWLRPLLDVGRAELRAYLRARGVVWIDDPSNEDDRYLRVRMRKALAILAQVGLTSQGLAQSTRHLARSRGALQQVVADFARDHVEDRWGAIELAQDAFARLDPDLQRRFLRLGLLWIVGGRYAPRAEGLERLRNLALQGGQATLGGIVLRAQGGRLSLHRELRACPAAQDFAPGLWDGRWQVSGPVQGQIAPLGAEGLKALGAWRELGIARVILLTSPAIWAEGRLLAAPLAGFGENWQADLHLDFVSFIHSH